MAASATAPPHRMALRLPVLVLVLAFTAVPVELRSLSQMELDLGWHVDDILANIAGYVPVGMVLGGLGPLAGMLIAALASGLAEASQLVMMHRFPSPMDLASNLAGAAIGLHLASRLGVRSPSVALPRWIGALAVVAAGVYFGDAAWAAISREAAEPSVSSKGVTMAGALDADWRFDERGGDDVSDASINATTGRFVGEPRRVAGQRGGAIELTNSGDYIAFGDPVALRLVRSMTVTAWINSTSYPRDDAAIVSNHTALGWQLDTTVDRGYRGIGFKLANACGGLIARYGRTPLALGRWYHVAGVYDADARTIDVYLDGRLDNGYLLGEIMGTQRISGLPAYVGRRAAPDGFPFTGIVDEVRVYSRALTAGEIAADMRGVPAGPPPSAPAQSMDVDDVPAQPSDPPCPRSGRQHVLLPGEASTFGMFAAVAVTALRPAGAVAGRLLPAAGGLAAGLLLVPVLMPTLPDFNFWTIPLLALAGGLSVAASVRTTTRA